MKKALICLSTVLVLSTATVYAQELVIPQPSTKQIITQEFGLGKIVLTYSRPNVKGRKIFGHYRALWTGMAYRRQLCNDAAIYRRCDHRGPKGTGR